MLCCGSDLAEESDELSLYKWFVGYLTLDNILTILGSVQCSFFPPGHVYPKVKYFSTVKHFHVTTEEKAADHRASLKFLLTMQVQLNG